MVEKNPEMNMWDFKNEKKKKIIIFSPKKPQLIYKISKIPLPKKVNKKCLINMKKLLEQDQIFQL